MSTFDINTYLTNYKALVEKALDEFLTVAYPEKLYEAMRYSVLAGGKRLRPILCLASCELLGGSIELAMPTACAMEMVHTMSLIHDDLPAMDNDDYRRGRLTNHKVYGEDMAILAGDALLSYAFELIAEKTPFETPPYQMLRVVGVLAKAVGQQGLVGGQVVDLESEGKTDISLETLNYIHKHKTSALLEACVVSGAILCEARQEREDRLLRYAQKIGLAFQIIDDILDITGSTEELGKTAGKDVKAQKVTYPSLWGLEESKRQADQLIEEAKAELDIWGERAIPLKAIADFIVSRKN